MSRLVLSDAVPNASGYNAPLTEDEVETIVSLKRDEGLSVAEISERTGRSDATIKRYLSRNGITSRSQRAKTPPLAKTQFLLIHSIKDLGDSSAEVSIKTGLKLGEVNNVYGAPTYDYYINHR